MNFGRIPSIIALWASVLALPGFSQGQGENLLRNPGFERGLEAWQGPWSRKAGSLKAETIAQGKERRLRLSHSSEKDWSFDYGGYQSAAQGELWGLSARVKRLKGQGGISIALALRDAGGRVLDWGFAQHRLGPGTQWQTIGFKALVPLGVASIQFRIIGEGKASFLVDDCLLSPLAGPRPAVSAEGPLIISRGRLRLAYNHRDQSLSLSRVGQGAESGQAAGAGDPGFVFDCQAWAPRVLGIRRVNEVTLEWDLLGDGGEEIMARASLEGEALRLSLDAQGPMATDFEFPGPIEARSGQEWVLPINEGIRLPGDSVYLQDWRLVLYSGHGLSMPFAGLARPGLILMAIAETPNDAYMRLSRVVKPGSGIAGEGSSKASFVWEPSLGEWSYPRSLELRLLDPQPGQEAHVRLAKSYRDYVQARGRLISLKQKEGLVPNLAKLRGAVNLWYWSNAANWSHDDAGVVGFARELRSLGVDRVLWSQAQSPQVVAELAKLGFLPGRYDIYQDVWGPDNPNAWVNRVGWPEGLVLLPDGNRMEGWVDRAANGRSYPGGVICSAWALEMERRQVTADLAKSPYQARFLDTTTASPLRECYNPAHPQSRSGDLKNKMELLSYLWREHGLVVGSETGFDAAVPYLHYFEGMESLGPYRLEDSGYDLVGPKPIPDEFRIFQVGPEYRIPLFQLVYHDCVVSSWYWGDSSNRLPEYWDERDLINALYGSMPLWIVDPNIWKAHGPRFVESYRRVCPVSQRLAYLEMLDHGYLGPGRSLQYSSFSDGTRVYANWGNEAIRLDNGPVIPARGSLMVVP